MEASELRVGNFVHDPIHKNELCEVRHIDRYTDTVGLTDGIGYAYNSFLDKIEPIPLTPEILEKCGLEYCEFGYKFPKKWSLILEWHQGWFLSKYPGLDFRISCEITSLHQFQNLYYAIFGEELIYRIKKGGEA